VFPNLAEAFECVYKKAGCFEGHNTPYSLVANVIESVWALNFFQTSYNSTFLIGQRLNDTFGLLKIRFPADTSH
jgi:hypothetical protein